MNSVELSPRYDGLISKSQEMRFKQEAAGTAFGAQILAQSLDLQKAQIATNLEQVKAKDGVGADNLLSSSMQTSINSVKFAPYSYGYSVDSKGFMGADFNKAAGLPQNFKIHKSTLDEIYDFNERVYLHKPRGGRAFDEIDIAGTIKEYYRLFSDVMGYSDKDFYAQDDLEGLPKGYSYSGADPFFITKSFLQFPHNHKVSNVYRDESDLNEALDISAKLGKMRDFSFATKKLDLTKSGLERNNGGGLNFNPDMSVYKNGDTFSKEGVFMGFLKSVRPIVSEKTSKLSLNTKAISTYDMAQTLAFYRGYFKDPNFYEQAANEILVNELLNYDSTGKDAQNSSFAEKIFADTKQKEEDMKILRERINALATSAI